MKTQSQIQNPIFENIFIKIDEKIKEIQNFNSLVKNISSFDDFLKVKKNLMICFSHIEDDLRETGQSLRSLCCINKNLTEQVAYSEKTLAEHEKIKEKLLFKNKELKEKIKKNESEIKCLTAIDHNFNNNINGINIKPIISDKKAFKNILENHTKTGNNTVINIDNEEKKLEKKDETKYEKEEKIREILFILLNSKDSLKLNQHCKNKFGSNFLNKLLAQDVESVFIHNLESTIKQFLHQQDTLKSYNINSEVDYIHNLNKSSSNTFNKHTDVYAKNFINNQPSNYHSFTHLSKGNTERSKSGDKNKRFIQYTSRHGNYFDKDYEKKFNSPRNNDQTMDEKSKTNTSLNRFSINNNYEPNKAKIYSYREKTRWRSMHEYFYSQNDDLDQNFQHKSPDKITNSFYNS